MVRLAPALRYALGEMKRLSDTLERAIDRAGDFDGSPDLAMLRVHSKCRYEVSDILSIPDAALARVLAAFDGDVDLAGTALGMTPRPEWVEELMHAR